MNLFSKKSPICDLIHADFEFYQMKKCLKEENEAIRVEFERQKLELQKQLNMLKFDLISRDCEVIFSSNVNQLILIFFEINELKQKNDRLQVESTKNLNGACIVGEIATTNGEMVIICNKQINFDIFFDEINVLN